MFKFSEAIRQAKDMVNLDETLIVVTADHAHTMSLSGYSKRGKDILGLNTELGDGAVYTWIVLDNFII